MTSPSLTRAETRGGGGVLAATGESKHAAMSQNGDKSVTVEQRAER